MVSATPDLRLPLKPQGVTAFDRYQVMLLGNRGMCVRELLGQGCTYVLFD